MKLVGLLWFQDPTLLFADSLILFQRFLPIKRLFFKGFVYPCWCRSKLKSNVVFIVLIHTMTYDQPFAVSVKQERNDHS